MADTLLFLVALVVSIRTFSYGLWTLSNRNTLGGIFVFLLSASVIALASYLLFFNRT